MTGFFLDSNGSFSEFAVTTSLPGSNEAGNDDSQSEDNISILSSNSETLPQEEG